MSSAGCAESHFRLERPRRNRTTASDDAHAGASDPTTRAANGSSLSEPSANFYLHLCSRSRKVGLLVGTNLSRHQDPRRARARPFYPTPLLPGQPILARGCRGRGRGGEERRAGASGAAPRLRPCPRPIRGASLHNERGALTLRGLSLRARLDVFCRFARRYATDRPCARLGPCSPDAMADCRRYADENAPALPTPGGAKVESLIFLEDRDACEAAQVRRPAPWPAHSRPERSAALCLRPVLSPLPTNFSRLARAPHLSPQDLIRAQPPRLELSFTKTRSGTRVVRRQFEGRKALLLGVVASGGCPATAPVAPVSSPTDRVGVPPACFPHPPTLGTSPTNPSPSNHPPTGPLSRSRSFRSPTKQHAAHVSTDWDELILQREERVRRQTPAQAETRGGEGAPPGDAKGAAVRGVRAGSAPTYATRVTSSFWFFTCADFGPRARKRHAQERHREPKGPAHRSGRPDRALSPSRSRGSPRPRSAPRFQPGTSAMRGKYATPLARAKNKRLCNSEHTMQGQVEASCVPMSTKCKSGERAKCRPQSSILLCRGSPVAGSCCRDCSPQGRCCQAGRRKQGRRVARRAGTRARQMPSRREPHAAKTVVTIVKTP